MDIQRPADSRLHARLIRASVGPVFLLVCLGASLLFPAAGRTMAEPEASAIVLSSNFAMSASCQTASRCDVDPSALLPERFGSSIRPELSARDIVVLVLRMASLDRQIDSIVGSEPASEGIRG